MEDADLVDCVIHTVDRVVAQQIGYAGDRLKVVRRDHRLISCDL